VTVPLEADAVVSHCVEATGLSDFGATGFLDRLGIVVAAMSENADLQDPGRRAGAALDLVNLVSDRLRFEGDRAREPAIAREVIERPLIVAGTPRSGSSLIQALLDEDPNGRAPREWEVHHPSPPPSLAGPDDPRRDRTTADVKEFCLRLPGMLIAHPYWDTWSEALVECEALYTLDLHNLYVSWFTHTNAVVDVPGLMDDAEGAFRFHRAMLQQLQWGAPPRHWVLKGNRHPFVLDALREAYPNADIIWLHRHPAKMFGSGMELQMVIAEGRLGRPLDRKVWGPGILDRWAGGVLGGLESKQIDHPKVYHLFYRDLRTDPVAAIRAIYEYFDREFSIEHEQGIRAWLASPDNAANRRGTFHYDLAWFGMTQADIEERFRPYIEHFGLTEADY
jgi:hypothetical protein